MPDSYDLPLFSPGAIAPGASDGYEIDKIELPGRHGDGDDDGPRRVDTLAHAFATAPVDTGTGHDGRQFEYWRSLGHEGAGSARRLVNAIIQGRVLPLVAPLVFGAQSQALRKKGKDHFAAKFADKGEAAAALERRRRLRLDGERAANWGGLGAAPACQPRHSATGAR